MEDIIKRFLSVSYGDGCGDGSGYGDGYGHGYGYGCDGCGSGSGSGYGDGYGSGHGYGSGDDCGDGSGDGCGSGSGSGYDGSGSGHGSGSGDGVKLFNSHAVHYIDRVPTIIHSVHGNYARGAILKQDLCLSPCYIAKCGDFFAHGDTLAEARADAEAKYNANLPVSERIKLFIAKFPSLATRCSHTELFDWHHILTGSCRAGRVSFCEEHGLNPADGTMTVRQFIETTRNAYGGEVINQLEQAYLAQ